MKSLAARLKRFITKPKKRTCIVCEERQAKFCIKGIGKNCYCKECALEQFSDIKVLEKV